MVRYRSILSLILVIVATFLVSCGSPTAGKVTETYTSAQIQQIQQYVPEVLALRDRMTREVQTLVNRKDWTDIVNFIHGPLGELRLQMTYVTRNLLPKDQDKARQLTRDLFDNLVKLDQAAQQGDAKRVVLNYREALGDIDAFLQLIPQPSSPSAEAVE